jgi:DNA-binding transcriptional MerR regulator
MQIGEVARRAGFAASTLRFYERIGLVPPPSRVSGRRRYTPEVLDRLGVIAFARASGFTLAETKQLFLRGKPYSARLRDLARTKLGEVEDMIRRAEAMKGLLRMALRCRCVDATICSRRLRATRTDY